MLDRLVSSWVHGGALAAVVLLLLLPVVGKNWTLLMVLTFLHLPVYMLHQLEEHDQDRFRTFFNRTIGEGHEALTRLAVFVTNVPGVWLLVTASICAASEVHSGWALAAVYLVLVNAVVHIVHAIVFKKYNPGLATALVLFLPLGGFTLWLAQITAAARPFHHLVCAGLAVLVHIVILVHVRWRVRRLKARAPAVAL